VSTGLHLPTVHRLHPFIKDCTKPKYNLRQRTHQKELISKSLKRAIGTFFVRMLYKDSY